ncbi:unnamed protein product [Oncorhynchus mykiss]|uniref:Palmdelphin n=1 Tax=Oncorhynchus mykiss TaxID=8022 RepID=A0A060WL39_ONCMY|nr:unnamed protein product [Oncorhynchus mykiss]
MEEADLVKERLQAITDKRKVQEDIAHKKLEIDKEKLKLQHLKKKSLREQWLMDGAATQSPQQRETLRGDQQQTKLLQTSIHRIEKEIEAMEREETMISKNEGFILKRLKAIEKTPEEIIKVLGHNIIDKTIYISPATLDVPKFYKPQISRKQSFKFNKDTPKQSKKLHTMFAMEINVQKDLRTGESRVLSTSTVTPQELQQRGVKVYDDGRKSVYALQSDGSHLWNGVDELSPIEVEELLRAATEQKKSQRGPRGHQGHQESAPAFSPNYSPRGHQEPLYEHDVLSRKELHYIDGVHYSGPESLSSSPHIPVPSFICRKDEEYYQPTNGYNQNPFSYGGEFHPTHNSYHSPRESQQGGMFYNSSAKKDQKPSPIYQEDLHFSILNAIDTSEPITAIFMGYQTAKDDSGRGLGYEGSIRAELVVIGDEDGVDESNPQLNTYNPDGYNNWGYHHSQPQQKLIQAHR